MKNTRILDALNYLAKKGVKFIIKTEYENSKPTRKVVIGEFTLTKKDQFFRVNGKIISRNMALELNRLGMVRV